MTEKYITVQEAADRLGMYPQSVRKLLLSKDLAGRKFGTVWQVEAASVRKYRPEGTGGRPRKGGTPARD